MKTMKLIPTPKTAACRVPDSIPARCRMPDGIKNSILGDKTAGFLIQNAIVDRCYHEGPHSFSAFLFH